MSAGHAYEIAKQQMEDVKGCLGLSLDKQKEVFNQLGLSPFDNVKEFPTPYEFLCSDVYVVLAELLHGPDIVYMAVVENDFEGFTDLIGFFGNLDAAGASVETSDLVKHWRSLGYVHLS